MICKQKFHVKGCWAFFLVNQGFTRFICSPVATSLKLVKQTIILSHTIKLMYSKPPQKRGIWTFAKPVNRYPLIKCWYYTYVPQPPTLNASNLGIHHLRLPHVQSRECTSRHSSAQTRRCPLFGYGGFDPHGLLPSVFCYDENLHNTPLLGQPPQLSTGKELHCFWCLKRIGVAMGGGPKWWSKVVLEFCFKIPHQGGNFWIQLHHTTKKRTINHKSWCPRIPQGNSYGKTRLIFVTP